MRIILEGPDASGKSTLAVALSTKLGWPIEHCGPPTDEAFDEYYAMLSLPGFRIYDRLFHGEMVYGPLLRQKSAITATEMFYLETLAMPALVIWCTAPPHIIAQRLATKEACDEIDQQVAERAEAFVTAYDRIAVNCAIPALVYDSNVMTVEQMTAEIFLWLYKDQI